jgi:Uri superfamily endonuclease
MNFAKYIKIYMGSSLGRMTRLSIESYCQLERHLNRKRKRKWK